MAPTSQYQMGQPRSSVVRAAHSSAQGLWFNSPPRGGENFSQQDAEDESSPATNGRGEDEKGKRKRKWESTSQSLWRHLIGAPGQVTKSLHLIGQPNQTNWLVECSRRSPQERVYKAAREGNLPASSSFHSPPSEEQHLLHPEVEQLQPQGSVPSVRDRPPSREQL